MNIKTASYPTTLLPPTHGSAPPAAAPSRPPADPSLATRIWNAATGAWEIGRKIIQPVHVLGDRVLPFSSSFPKDPYAALTRLEAQVTTFENIQGQLPVVQPLAASIPQKILATPSPSLSSQVAETQKELTKLSRQLSHFTILYALHWAASKTNDDQVAKIFELTQRAAEPGAPSLKQLVFNQYPNLNCFRRLLVHILYFICTFRGLVEKTVTAYANQLLAEGRAGLTRTLQSGEETESNLVISHLIDDLGAFFRAYADAAVAHAKGKPLIGLNGVAIPYPTLRQYKEIMIQRLYGKSLRTLCSEFTSLLIRKIAPTVEYKKGAWILNPLMNGSVKWFLRIQLPAVLDSALKQITEETKPYKRPFVKAFCEVLIDLLENLQKTHAEGDLDPPAKPFRGTDNVPSFVAEFLRVLDIGENPTRKAVLNQVAKEKESAPYDKVHQPLHDALVNGVNASFHYLAKPENREKTLTKTITLLGVPFTTTQNVTQNHITVLENKLLTLGKELLESFVQESVEDKLRNGPRRDVVDRVTQKAFETRKIAVQDLSLKLERTQATLLQHFQQQTLIQPGGWAEIQKELIAAKDTLSYFAFIEKQSTTSFSHVPAADQEAILRPLLPIYDQALAAMDSLLEIEQALQAYYASSLLSSDYVMTFNLLERFDLSYAQGIAAANNLSQLRNDAAVEQRRASYTELETATRQTREWITQCEQILARLRDKLTAGELGCFEAFLVSCRAMEVHFQQISALHHLDLQLRTYLDNPRAVPKPLDLTRFAPNYQKILHPLIAALVAVQRNGTPNSQIIEALSQQLSLMQREILAAVTTTQHQIQQTQTVLHMRHLAGTKQQEQQTIQAHLFANLQRASQNLAQTSGTLQNLTHDAEKEEHYQITDNVMGVSAGTIGAASAVAGAALNTIVPGASFVMPALTGAAYGSVEPLVDRTLGQSVSFAQPAISAASAIGFTALLTPLIGPIGAAAAVGGGGLGWTAWNARKRAVNQAQTTVVTPVLDLLFKQGKAFFTNDFVYQGAERIALARFIHAYA